MAEDEVTEQELLDARQLKVSTAVQTLSTVSSLAYHRLAEEHRDPSKRASRSRSCGARSCPLRIVPPELQRDFEPVLANLQLAYASAVEPRALTRGTPSLCYIIPHAEHASALTL